MDTSCQDLCRSLASQNENIDISQSVLYTSLMGLLLVADKEVRFFFFCVLKVIVCWTCAYFSDFLRKCLTVTAITCVKWGPKSEIISENASGIQFQFNTQVFITNDFISSSNFSET